MRKLMQALYWLVSNPIPFSILLDTKYYLT